MPHLMDHVVHSHPSAGHGACACKPTRSNKAFKQVDCNPFNINIRQHSLLEILNHINHILGMTIVWFKLGPSAKAAESEKKQKSRMVTLW